MSNVKRRLEAGLPTEHSPHSFKWGQKVEDKWVDLQCAFNDYGIRCEAKGTVSPSTTGSGPWYCRLHFGRSGPGRYDS